MKSFLLQFTSIKEESLFGHIFRETEISHFAGGAYCSIITDRCFDESEVALHFLDVSSDFQYDVFSNGNGVTITHGTTQNERFRYQLDASVPLMKQLWQQTIKVKIENQARVLEKCTGEVFKCMKVWASEVRSGDSENMEARAAAFYWKNLFLIEGFTRGRDGIPPNNLLNYGYAILRAVVARGLVSSGLLPTLGIHHHNRYNAYCLADDIMEPYRPYVDELVYGIVNSGLDYEVLSKEIKAKLLTIPTLEVNISGKRSPLMIAVGQTTASLYKCFNGELRKIIYPEM